MANRSDFMEAALPRPIKRMITLMGANSPEQRKIWIDAHRHHKRFKMRQNSSSFGRAATANDVPDTDAE